MPRMRNQERLVYRLADVSRLISWPAGPHTYSHLTLMRQLRTIKNYYHVGDDRPQAIKTRFYTGLVDLDSPAEHIQQPLCMLMCANVIRFFMG